MRFDAEHDPFPAWLGAFSPSRGRFSGFRVRGRQIGAWMTREDALEFWHVEPSPGTRALVDAVMERWNGGRVLLLASGHVIKPLQKDTDVGKRVLLGKIAGRVVLVGPEGERFDMAEPEAAVPGSLWTGPNLSGLECIMGADGSLSCRWTLPVDDRDPTFRQQVQRQLAKSDAKLAAGFRKARPGESTGRVRLTVHGHLTTSRQISHEEWETRYVGQVDPASIQNLE